MSISVCTIARPGGVAVVRRDGEFHLLSTRAVGPGELLFLVEGTLTSVATRYSVQVGPSLHVDLPAGLGLEEVLDTFYWRFMNHSCEPNVAVRGRDVRSLRNIEQWEEITFDYNTTEYDLAEKFDCRCGSARCLGRVGGFAHLPRASQERLRPHLARHLSVVLDEGLEQAAGRDGGVVLER